MGFDEGLAQRLRDALIDERGVTEKKMFGGLCLLVGGKMSLGIVDDELMVHVGDAYGDALKRSGARPMDFTGRPMKGLVFVSAQGIESETALEEWVRLGVASARARLKAEQGKASRRRVGKKRPVGR